MRFLPPVCPQLPFTARLECHLLQLVCLGLPGGLVVRLVPVFSSLPVSLGINCLLSICLPQLDSKLQEAGMVSVEFTAASPAPFIDSFIHPSRHLLIQQTPRAGHVAASQLVFVE